MMLLGSLMRVSSVGCESAGIAGSSIPFQSTATYLGVHLDQTLSMKEHISSLCRTTFLALRRIASIRPFLSNSSTVKLLRPWSRKDWTAAMLLSRAYKRSRTKTRGFKIRNKFKNRSVVIHTAFNKPSLAPSKIPHSVQDRNAHFPLLLLSSSFI